jgi:cytoskeleton protein RodZ
MSLDDLARATRVAPRYLIALEADAFAELPAPVFIRGFIRAYCQALGESPVEALTCFDGHDGPAPPVPTRTAPARTGGEEPRARGAIVVSFVLLVVLGMALFTVALVIRPGDRAERAAVEARQETRAAAPPTIAPTGTPVGDPAVGSPPPPDTSSPAPVAPSKPKATSPPVAPATRSPVAGIEPVPPPAAVAASVAKPAATDAGSPASSPEVVPFVARPSAPIAPPSPEVVIGSVSSPYRLIARTSEATWIRVRTDDGRISEETVPGGEIREWVSDRPFVVTVGNAGGVSLELNGRALPPLGARGIVIPKLVLPPEPR